MSSSFTSLWLAALVVLGGCGPPPPAAISVLDLDGRTVAPFQGGAQEFEVLVFVAPDCPISNKLAPEIERIREEYSRRGVDFHLVYADGGVQVETIRRHVADFALTAPVLLDFEHRLVELAGATVTPEAALFTSAGELLYAGRIDDRFVDFGKERESPTRTDLRDALEAVLAGARPAHARTQAVGCFIPEPE